MKTWTKVILGIAALPLILVVGGGVALVAMGKWKQVAGFGSGVLQLKHGAESLKNLDKEFPFAPPADGAIPEDRLVAYLAVCEAVKPVAAPYETWFQAHQGQQGDFKDAQKAVGMLAVLMESSMHALQSQKMSAREFGWIDRAVANARREATEKAGTPVAREMLATLRDAAKAPGLSEAERKSLHEKIRRYDQSLKKTGEPISPNGALFLRHAERLKAAELGEFGGILLEGAGSPRRRGPKSVS